MNNELIRKSEVLEIMENLIYDMSEVSTIPQLAKQSVENLPPVSVIKLPCNIGDTVYCIENNFGENDKKTATICERKVTGITLDKDDLWIRVDDEPGTYYSALLLDNGIFKTHYKAEQKLAEWQKGMEEI